MRGVETDLPQFVGAYLLDLSIREVGTLGKPTSVASQSLHRSLLLFVLAAGQIEQSVGTDVLFDHSSEGVRIARIHRDTLLHLFDRRTRIECLQFLYLCAKLASDVLEDLLGRIASPKFDV